MNATSIPVLFRNTADEFPQNPAVSFVDEKPVLYGEMKKITERTARMLLEAGVKKGDRVAILSQNMPQWSMAYIAITATGAVAVPLMPDFKSHEVAKILEHAEARLVFASGNLSGHVPDSYPVIKLEEIHTEILADEKGDTAGFSIGDIPVNGSDLASIIYTSGTTGDPKGVMLSHENILFTVAKSALIQPMNSADRFLSVLPLSHIYEFSLGLILPFMFGAGVTYLRKPPTGPVLLPAMKSVKPTVMLTVPLLIEKVFWKSVYPKFNGSFLLKNLYKVPVFRKLLHKIAGKKVYKTFGGCLKFYGIGGSKLDARVERFLYDAGFPYAIGYGLTESSPLLAGGSPGKFTYQSTGPAMEGVELRIHNPDVASKLGEIQARGKNIMQGYYKNPELTREVFEDQTWFKTGDLGYIDKHGHLHIKGRLKNTIIGANGKNIFPEEIENIINSLNYVKESLVLEKKGKLVGLIHLDYEAIEQQLQQLKVDASIAIRDKVNAILEEIHQQVNQHVNKFSRLQMVLEQPIPFERTPTQKIKRFLYQ